ncbi:hypothetical protein [Cytobacillus purgationiresistens]|nr:hypothetical protein [Cytobacillus purgationiresistens]
MKDEKNRGFHGDKCVKNKLNYVLIANSNSNPVEKEGIRPIDFSSDFSNK